MVSFLSIHHPEQPDAHDVAPDSNGTGSTN